MKIIIIFVLKQFCQKKYNKIIVLDAGHGGEMPGAIGNDLIEKDFTLKIALSAQKKFDNDSSIKC